MQREFTHPDSPEGKTTMYQCIVKCDKYRPGSATLEDDYIKVYERRRSAQAALEHARECATAGDILLILCLETEVEHFIKFFRKKLKLEVIRRDIE